MARPRGASPATILKLKFIEELIGSPPDVCVLWPWSCNDQGYGLIMLPRASDGKRVHQLVTRFVLRCSDPRDNEGELFACHKPLECHNPLCINPKHLRWGTATDNARDRRLDGTKERGTSHSSCKLTESQVLEIYHSMETQRALGVAYGISQGMVSDIKRGVSWSWLTKG